MDKKLLKEFVRQKDYLICVDSDGCAMDTMDVKHKKCFGPCIVKEWKLERWEKEILNRWNEINLYSVSRGINRFKGLALMLSEINANMTKIDGLEDLAAWAENAVEVSNDSLRKEIEKTGSECLKKTLDWSLKVNEAIDRLDDS